MILFVTPAVDELHGALEAKTLTGLNQLDDVKYVSIGDVGREDLKAYRAIVTIGWKPRKGFIALGAKARIFGKPFITISDGYIKRSVDSLPRYSSGYWAISLNALNTYSEAPFSECPPDRWQALHVELKPWMSTGSRILVAHQHGATGEPFKRLLRL